MHPRKRATACNCPNSQPRAPTNSSRMPANMKVLFIGGTGFISTAVTRLALARGIELYHLNRGQRAGDVEGVKRLTADVHNPDQVRAALNGHQFDVVVDWVAYQPSEVERDI